MAKSKLKSALNRQLGKDPAREKQLKISRKKSKKARKNGDDEEVPELVDTAKLPKPTEADEDENEDDEEDEDEDEADGEVAKADGKKAASKDAADDDDDKEEDEDEDDDDEAEDSDVALSDLGDSDVESDADMIPYQKLTIDNHAALTQLHATIRLPPSLPFSAHQCVTAPTPTAIADINDDLTRELAFYAQALAAARTGRDRLKKEGVRFSRPADYFAEMMKDDEHMGRIKQKLLDEAEGKKRSQEARKLRDLKKFGKQVQVQKLQEREKQKKETLEKINILKRKRKESDTDFTEEADMFDVALEEQTKDARGGRRGTKPGAAGKGGAPNPKRAKRDSKFGFGGKKRFSKSGDAVSSGDLSGFNAKKNRESFGGGGKKKGKPARPGKSKRAAKR